LTQSILNSDSYLTLFFRLKGLIRYVYDDERPRARHFLGQLNHELAKHSVVKNSGSNLIDDISKNKLKHPHDSSRAHVKEAELIADQTNSQEAKTVFKANTQCGDGVVESDLNGFSCEQAYSISSLIRFRLNLLKGDVRFDANSIVEFPEPEYKPINIFSGDLNLFYDRIRIKEIQQKDNSCNFNGSELNRIYIRKDIHTCFDKKKIFELVNATQNQFDSYLIERSSLISGVKGRIELNFEDVLKSILQTELVLSLSCDTGSRKDYLCRCSRPLDSKASARQRTVRVQKKSSTGFMMVVNLNFRLI
jgi:hypothetical protein